MAFFHLDVPTEETISFILLRGSNDLYDGIGAKRQVLGGYWYTLPHNIHPTII